MGNHWAECRFCRSPRTAGDPPEHVFPQWISRALGTLPGTGDFELESDSELPRITGRVIGLTTLAVCRACNHGWMSDLESAASPLLRRAVLGGGTSLPVSSHRSIGTWAVKNALMLDAAYGDFGHSELAPDEHYRELFDSRSPRYATYVWTTSFGYVPGVQGFRHAWSSRTELAAASRLDGSRFNGYAVTFQFGYLVTQVVSFDTDKQGFDSFGRADLRIPDGNVLPAREFTRQVWPSTGHDLAWPPPRALEAAGLGLFASQPPFVA
jgi:hypothetical protein